MSDAEKKSFSIKSITKHIPVPTLIIAVFWILVLFLGLTVNMTMPMMLTDVVKRFAINGIMVLAMVPAIQSGTGPNFALPLGIVCGLLGEICAIEMGFTGWGYLGAASLLAIAIAIVVGYGYGKLMNAVKGSEMTIATYTGFAACGLMGMAWLMLPFKNQAMRWFLGTGLRETIQLDAVGAAQILNNLWDFTVWGVHIPTGMLLMFFLLCFLVWLFFRSKKGIAISAGGINPMFAKATGLNVDSGRVFANVLSTILGALGIIAFAQGFGYTQLYNGPLMMAFPAVAGILIGGATAQRSKVFHVILGTFLFQALITTAPAVTNRMFAGTDLSETMRMMVQNGIILYALTQVKGGGK